MMVFPTAAYDDVERAVDDLVKHRADRPFSRVRSPKSPTSPSSPTTGAGLGAPPSYFSRLLMDARRGHREAYRAAHDAHHATLGPRDAAITARNARLNRDWYKHHVEADIDSYERADLDFDPPDLITIDELVATLNPNEAEVLSNMSPREAMPKRFHHEQLARLRTWGQVTQRQSTKKTLQGELLRALAKEDIMDKEITTWCTLIEDIAKKHNVDIQAAREKRDAPPSSSDDDESDDRDDAENASMGSPLALHHDDDRSPPETDVSERDSRMVEAVDDVEVARRAPRASSRAAGSTPLVDIEMEEVDEEVSRQ